MALPGAEKTAPAAPATGGTAKAMVVIPFTRAAQTKSEAMGQVGPVQISAANLTNVAAIQIPPGGFLRRLRLTVSGVTAGNIAAVTFNGDGPFNVLQNLTVTQPNGTPIYQPIDGFTLYLLNKYGAFGTGRNDPLADPNYSVTTGAGATGGSFNFNLIIPLEVDERDGLGSLMNMAANQAYQLQFSLAAGSTLYGVAPTAMPTITITPVMEYYSAPAPAGATGAVQQTAPTPNGSVSLVQTQNPVITPNAAQKFQILNMGNAVRFCIFILRTAAGVRTEADWPTNVNIKWLGDVRFYKTKQNWRKQMVEEYQYTAGVTAAPTLNSFDNGVYVLTDFMNAGSSGNSKVDGGSNRDLLLLTQDTSKFEFEALTAWGANASTLTIVQNSINPSTPDALYHPFFI